MEASRAGLGRMKDVGKSHASAAFLSVLASQTLNTARAGWRRSADRTSLRSLFPANREFNRDFRARAPFVGEPRVDKAAQIKCFTCKFPALKNREFRTRNSDLGNGISEFTTRTWPKPRVLAVSAINY